LRSGLIVGAEALIRWAHPSKGFIPPVAFIPLAESSGFIIDIGEWVLNKACLDCARWNTKGLTNINVAVNVSSLQFKRGNLELLVLNALQQSGISGELLELELTESLLTENSKMLKSTLSSLRQQGVKFSIDDFGTGYSNLSYLKNFDVEILKIDQSFIRKLLENQSDRAIVNAIIQMATSLNMKTVAEGVEDENVLTEIRAMNCHIGQGFHWSKPLPFDEFVKFYNLFNR